MVTELEMKVIRGSAENICSAWRLMNTIREDQPERYADFIKSMNETLDRYRSALADYMVVLDRVGPNYPLSAQVHMNTERDDFYGEGIVLEIHPEDSNLRLIFWPGGHSDESIAPTTGWCHIGNLE